MAFQDLTAFLDTLPGLDTPGVDCIVMRDHGRFTAIMLVAQTGKLGFP